VIHPLCSLPRRGLPLKKRWTARALGACDHCIYGPLLDQLEFGRRDQFAWSEEHHVSNATLPRGAASFLSLSAPAIVQSTKNARVRGFNQRDIGSFHHNLWPIARPERSLAGGYNQSGLYVGRARYRNNVVYNWTSRRQDGGVARDELRKTTITNLTAKQIVNGC